MRALVTIVLIAAFSVIAICGVGYVYRSDLFRAVRYVDKQYLSEGLKDAVAQFNTDERWNDIPVHHDYNYAWLETATKPIRIAHRLGGSAEAANDFAALYRSRARSFRFYEVDIWLDGDGVLRCHHGPVVPKRYVAGECDLVSLARLLTAREYLILDLKTPFKASFDAVLKQVDATDLSRHIIFQLYRPEDVDVFAAHYQAHHLLGPIVSIYNAQRSANHVFDHVAAAGVRAFTLPYARIPALTHHVASDDAMVVLTHQANTCDAVSDAMRLGVSGFYINNSLECFE